MTYHSEIFIDLIALKFSNLENKAISNPICYLIIWGMWNVYLDFNFLRENFNVLLESTSIYLVSYNALFKHPFSSMWLDTEFISCF